MGDLFNVGQTKGKTMSEYQLIISVTALVISVLTLLYNFTKDFLIGENIKVNINSIISLRLVGTNRNALLIDILTADLKSKNPSQEALIIACEIGINGMDKAMIDRNIVDVSIFKAGKTINYNPTDEQVRSFFGESVFKYCFAIPIVVSNTGNKNGNISKVIAILKDSIGEKWAYTALLELDTNKLLAMGQVISDAERIKSFFHGLCLPSNSRESLTLFMVPIDDAEGRIINKKSPSVGTYEISIIGFNAECKPCFSKVIREHKISDQMLLGSFRGADASNDFHSEKCISIALRTV